MAEQNREEVKTNYEVYQNDIAMSRFNSYTGIVRMNEIPAAAVGKRPRGWYIRERFDSETNKTVSLELGAYLSEDIFIGVPVHFAMKNMFLKIECGDTDFTYYQIPMSARFGIAQYTSKKDGTVKPLLVAPDEKHPPVFIAAFATNAKQGCILNCAFANILPGESTDGTTPIPNVVDLVGPELAPTCKTKVLKKYFDKDRDVIAAIVFQNVDEESAPEISVHITHGVVNTNINNTEEIITFNNAGWTTETFSKPVTQPNAIQFIAMPMYLESSRRQIMQREAAANGGENKENAQGFKKPYYNKNKNYNKKPYNKKPNQPENKEDSNKQ